MYAENAGILSELKDWASYVAPELSNGVLAVLGILMSFPQLADKIEQSKFWRRLIGISCIVLALVGGGYGIYSRRGADKDTRTLVNSTNALVQNTNDGLTKMDALRGIVISLGEHLPKDSSPELLAQFQSLKGAVGIQDILKADPKNLKGEDLIAAATTTLARLETALFQWANSNSEIEMSTRDRIRCSNEHTVDGTCNPVDPQTAKEVKAMGEQRKSDLEVSTVRSARSDMSRFCSLRAEIVNRESASLPRDLANDQRIATICGRVDSDGVKVDDVRYLWDNGAKSLSVLQHSVKGQ